MLGLRTSVGPVACFVRGYRSTPLSFNPIDWTKMQIYPKYPIRFEESKITSKRADKEITEFYEQAGIVVEGENVPKPLLSFDEWASHDVLKRILMEKQWKKPTPIQSAAWPIAIRGRDLVGNVKTGSGKTLAFVLPALQHIQAQPIQRLSEGPSVLVLSPTRELAAQTCECFQDFGAPYSTRTALVCGGVRKYDQISELKRGAHVYAATPGRLLDLIFEGVINTKKVTFLVIDEADKLIEMGFEDQLYDIMKQIRPDAQTSMWTATMPEDARAFALEMLKDPVFITEHKETLAINPDITHDVLVLNPSEKLNALQFLVDTMNLNKDNKLVVFINSKGDCNATLEVLRKKNVKAVGLHGNMDHTARMAAVQDFKTGRAFVVVATDLASRGLDFQNVNNVLNYDMPFNIENYVHRCGRTGRIGNKGTAITLFTSDNLRVVAKLVEYLRKCGQKVSEQLEELNKLSTMRRRR